MIDAARRLVALALGRSDPPDGRVVIGVAGAVASGKSTLADAVAGAALEAGRAAHVVATDGFLFPNSVLVERGLLARKGFPESYDVAALEQLVDAVRSGAPEVTVPIYSHETYDVVAGMPLGLGSDALLVVEGVNALAALPGRLDLGVYVHAEEPDLEEWYVARFHALCAEADDRSFYRQFRGMTFDDVDALARQVWQQVNLVNLREHIAPSRALADCVVVKGRDHELLALQMRDDESFAG